LRRRQRECKQGEERREGREVQEEGGKRKEGRREGGYLPRVGNKEEAPEIRYRFKKLKLEKFRGSAHELIKGGSNFLNCG
jgi:hypothetical protein